MHRLQVWIASDSGLSDIMHGQRLAISAIPGTKLDLPSVGNEPAPDDDPHGAADVVRAKQLASELVDIFRKLQSRQRDEVAHTLFGPPRTDKETQFIADVVSRMAAHTVKQG